MKPSYIENYRNLNDARYACPDFVLDTEKSRFRVEELEKALKEA